MSHPIRPALAGLALAAMLMGVSACGSSSTTSSSSTTTSTSAATSSPSASDGQTSTASTTPTDSTSPSTGDSASASASDSASPSMSGVPGASTLYQDAKHTALTATSAHVQGSETDNGEKITIDVTGRTDATNMQETVEKNADGRLTVLVVDGRFWVRGDRAALAQFAGAQAASRIGSKWVQVPSSKGRAFVQTNSLKTLLQKMFSSDITAADDEGTRVTLTELGGKPAYRMSDTADDFSMWISTDPDHHAMRIGGPKEGYIDFTDWNSAPLQKAPSASEVYHP